MALRIIKEEKVERESGTSSPKERKECRQNQGARKDEKPRSG